MTITQQADLYAATHSDVRQAYLDGYRAARAKRDKTLDLSVIDDAYKPVVTKWLAYKKERGQSYTQRGVLALYKRFLALSGGNAAVAAAVAEQSMANSWSGLFPLSDDARGKYRRQSLAEAAAALADPSRLPLVPDKPIEQII